MSWTLLSSSGAQVQAGSCGYSSLGTVAAGSYRLVVSAQGLAGTYTLNVNSVSAFFPAGPVRLMDTRTGTGGTTGPVAAGTTVLLQVAGVSGVPSSGVTSVVLNLTAVSPSGSGFLEAYPHGTTAPTVSDVSVHILADLAGYYR